MAFEIRLLTDADLPALQQVYETSARSIQRLIGQPADPGQALRDYFEALRTPGRFLFGVQYEGAVIGAVDCKLDDSEEGLAHIGLLLIIPPVDDPDIRGLALRVVERWLAASYGVRRVETASIAHVPEEIDFWRAQGYEFTGEQFRRELPRYAPRFLVLGKRLYPPTTGEHLNPSS